MLMDRPDSITLAGEDQKMPIIWKFLIFSRRKEVRKKKKPKEADPSAVPSCSSSPTSAENIYRELAT